MSNLASLCTNATADPPSEASAHKKGGKRKPSTKQKKGKKKQDSEDTKPELIISELPMNKDQAEDMRILFADSEPAND